MIWVFVVGLLVCTSTVPLILPALRAIALDTPSHRSSHDLPTPRGGGLAVVSGLLAGCVTGSWLFQAPDLLVIGGILAMTCLGLADDLWSLPVASRLSLTILIGFVLSISLLQPSGFTSWLVVLVVVLLISGYTNAFNFMDGVNGISALNAALAGGWLAFLAQREGNETAMIIALGLTGASLGFLPWNAPRARVFLGDCGSYGVGFAISVVTLVVWQSGAPLLLAVAPLWIYVADTFVTFVRRVAAGQGWSDAHRDHVYQRLVDGGLTHLTSAALVALTGGMVCALGWFTRDVPALSAITAMVVSTAYIALPGFFRGSARTVKNA